jgi:hypothetical protein
MTVPVRSGPVRSGFAFAKCPLAIDNTLPPAFPAKNIFFGAAVDSVLPIDYITGMNTNEHKQRAAAAGIEWPTVLAAYREVRAIECEQLERIGDFRRDAFRQLSGDDHGGRFKGRHRDAFAGGDATYIRGLDVTAAGRGMTADELYDDLADGAPGFRPADDVMSEVIDRLIDHASADEIETTWTGLVAAAAAADITEQWLRQLVKAGKVRGRKVGRRWEVAAADVAFFQRHPTAGRPRLRAHLEASPF